MLVAMQHLLGKAGKLREKHRAEEPHPADAQQRAEHHGLLACQLEVAPGFGERVPVDHQARVGRRRMGNELCADAAHDRNGHAGHGHLHMADLGHGNQETACDLTQQDGDKSAHLHHAVAAREFAVIEHLWQIGELDGAEQRGVQSHEEHAQQQHRHIGLNEAPGRDQHDGDLEVLDQAEHASLVPFVGQLARSGRKQQIRQGEQRTDHQARHGRRQPRDAELIGNHHREGELEEIVIARTGKLRPEKRRKAALAQQGELVGVGMLLCSGGRMHGRRGIHGSLPVALLALCQLARIFL